MTRLRILLPIIALAAPIAASAQDAAPGSNFATDIRVTIAGTVSSFDWTDPHCQMTVVVPLPDGREIAWSLDLAAPAELEAQGWRPGSVKPGHKVELEVNPSLDGSASGYVLAARKGSGKPIGRAASS
jgi:hypothetical protein